jgi:hypothetical protein
MKIKQEGRSRKELQTENWNLRCMLWILATQQGGELRITSEVAQLFNPKTSRLNVMTDLTNKDFVITAETERP